MLKIVAHVDHCDVDEFGIKSLVHGFGSMNLWSLVVYKMKLSLRNLKIEIIE